MKHKLKALNIMTSLISLILLTGCVDDTDKDKNKSGQLFSEHSESSVYNLLNAEKLKISEPPNNNTAQDDSEHSSLNETERAFLYQANIILNKLTKFGIKFNVEETAPCVEPNVSVLAFICYKSSSEYIEVSTSVYAPDAASMSQNKLSLYDYEYDLDRAEILYVEMANYNYFTNSNKEIRFAALKLHALADSALMNRATRLAKSFDFDSNFNQGIFGVKLNNTGKKWQLTLPDNAKFNNNEILAFLEQNLTLDSIGRKKGQFFISSYIKTLKSLQKTRPSTFGDYIQESRADILGKYDEQFLNFTIRKLYQKLYKVVIYKTGNEPFDHTLLDEISVY